MKVLASVYACSPYDGSERAVGWNWLKELNKYHEITALTSYVYKNDIEHYLAKNPSEMDHIRFVYINVPHSSWHVGYRLERLYYMLWQKQAVKTAKKLLKKEHYDLVHHITYVTCILPTEMYKLGIPFLYGPVSGGENIPSVIGYPMGIKSRITEAIRIGAQYFFRATPNFARAMHSATLILATTEETKSIISKKYYDKVEIFQSIGLSKEMFYPEPLPKPERSPKFLMAGRMLYWKGFEMGIGAFVKALEGGFKGELVILGDTENNLAYESYREYLKTLSGKYYDHQIKFISKVEHSKMKDFYDEFDVLINCSLRDSGCFVVMEAMSRGLPVIVVDTGGPKVNTTSNSAVKIKPAHMQQMVDQISDALIDLGTNKLKRERMGKAARKYAFENFLLEKRTEKMCEYYKLVVSSKGKS